MLKFDRLIYVKNNLTRFFPTDDLIASAFDGCPELVEFTFRKSSEYDDNNYSDQVELSSVNGHVVNYEGDYEEDYEEDEEKKAEDSLPVVDKKVVESLVELVYEIGKDWGYGEDITIERKDYISRKRRRTKADKDMEKFLSSYLTKKRLPESFFVKGSDENLALYYAVDHGRFSKEAEFKIFAREGRMYSALRYAKEIVNGPLPAEVENFFLLNDKADTDDHKYLQEYLSWKNKTQIVETT
jgi:hypothetical protein